MEKQYLRTLSELVNVPPQPSRNGSVRTGFGAVYRHDDPTCAPCITTKRVFTKAVKAELCMFVLTLALDFAEPLWMCLKILARGDQGVEGMDKSLVSFPTTLFVL